MKKTKILLPLVVLITLSQAASALELPVVSKYSEAEQAQIWVKSKADQVPAALMDLESVGNPTDSYSTIFPKNFLQESQFVVCYQNCDNKDSIKLKNGEITNKEDWNAIEQSNVYFWLNRYFNFIESKLNFRLDKHLRVLTNRDVREDGKKLTNNAFFNPQEISLSFLPANKNLLFKLMAGKINRSGFDPSVIAHEASHYLFHHLFPHAVNDEISGLNEGFADYIAHIFLDSPKVGLVMLQGKALRDSSSMIASNNKPKIYEPRMEVHDLGERVSHALWETRKLVQDKEEYDRLVIDAVLDLNSNPYSAVHDFKSKMIARTKTLLDTASLKLALATWEYALGGETIKIDNTNFLNKEVSKKSFIGFKTRQILPLEIVKTYGIEQIQESNFTVNDFTFINSKQIATNASVDTKDGSSSYWIARDLERGNVLGIYDSENKLVTEGKQLEEATKLAEQVGYSYQESLLKKFTQSVTDFKGLLDGKGNMNVAYKVKSTTEKDFSITFNGEEFNGKAIEIALKRKLLTAVLGVPAVDKITLYAIPGEIEGLPEVNGQSIIGYKLQLPDGTETEQIINKFQASKI